MIVIISKVQIRRGLEVELPGSPINLDPLSLSPGLDIGELGFTEDTNRLFIGYSPTTSDPNYLRPVFPYQNLEILTENSPRNQELFSGFIKDQDESDFFVPVTIQPVANALADIPYAASLLNPAKLVGSVVSATFEYHTFDANNGKPVKQGTLRVLANQSTSTSNTTIVEGGEYIEAVSGVSFGIRKDNSGNFFMLQCQNNTANAVNLYLRRVILTGG